MLKSIEEVCNDLPHFGSIQPEGKNIDIWAEPITIRNKDDFHKPGIYCIENYRLNKIYIGMSKDIATRINTHRRELNPHTKMCHHNSEMYHDSLTYGFHNFSFGVLETFEGDVEREFLLMREEEWIRYFENQSSKCIYNKNRCNKYNEITYTPGCDIFSPEEQIINNVLLNDPDRNLMKFEDKETKDIVKSVRVTESINKLIEDSPNTLSEIIEMGLSVGKSIQSSQRESFPIDYLISDVLAMKLEAHNIRNDKLFAYADYLEKRFMQFKKGELDFTREI